MVLENRDTQYSHIAWHLIQSLYMDSGGEDIIATLGFFIALDKQGRLTDHMDIDEFEYIYNESIELGNNTNIRLQDVCHMMLNINTVFTIVRIMGDIQDLDHSKFFEAVISVYSTREGRKRGDFYQPKELTYLVTRLLNESGAESVYNPFAGIASYQLENPKLNIVSQELNRKTWLIGKLRLLINEIDATYTCEDSLINWVGDGKKFDAIIGTPPFYILLTQEQKYRLNWNCDFNHRRVESIFLDKSLNSLNAEGTIIAVVSSQFLHSNDSRAFREFIVQEQHLQKIIELPQNVFSTTTISTAIVVLTKYKNEHVTFIDASEYCTKWERRNIIDWERILKINNKTNLENVCIVNRNAIAKQDYHLIPYLYFEVEDNIPEGYSNIELQDVVEIIRGTKCENDSIKGYCVNIGDLSSDALYYTLNPNTLQFDKVKTNYRRITTPVLLLSKIRTLKPTYVDASELQPIYISPNIMAVSVDTSKIDIPYLAYELFLRSDNLQKGNVIPNIRNNDILKLRIAVPSLQSQQDVIKQEQAIINSLIIADKNAKIKEHDLGEVIELKEQESKRNMRARRHAMNQVLNGLSPAISSLERCVNSNDLGKYIVAFRTEETIEVYMQKISGYISKLEVMVDTLLIENKYSDAEPMWIENFIDQYINDHISDNYTLDFAVRSIAEEDIHIWQDEFDSEVIGRVDIKQGEHLCSYRINIASKDLTQLFDNIIDNARQYGFTDPNRKDYTVRFEVHEEEMLNGCSAVAISILNNGLPLGDGVTPANIFTWGIGKGSGIGASQAKDIVEHFKGTIKLNEYPEDIEGFKVEYRIVFPTTNIL